MAGKYFEDLPVGLTVRHELGRTITEMDNVLFSSLTLNTQPLHLNEDFAAKSEFGQRIVNGILSLGMVVGITVNDLTAGTIIANLGYEHIKHPHPLFHGDTLYVETEVLEARPSLSRPDCGVVKLRHLGRNQAGVVCVDVIRTALFMRRPTV